MKLEPDDKRSHRAVCVLGGCSCRCIDVCSSYVDWVQTYVPRFATDRNTPRGCRADREATAPDSGM
jgi:hypothetical protein